ncbi:MAG: hypothetical protein OXH77_01415 [Anaerolineaceae bacterium]|nr:hypothetical protein [Anaerolineaceae bacterium]
MSTSEERLARLEEGYAHVATQAGLESVRGELKADIVAVRGELKETGGELKAEIEILRGEVKALAGSFKVWIIIAAIVQAGISALVSLALRSPV